MAEKLEFKNSTTPDFIPHFILKKTAWIIAPYVITLFRQSFDSGDIPQLWKTSVVVPIFRSGSVAMLTITVLIPWRLFSAVL